MAVPAGEMEDDSTLVRAVQGGDLEAYSELFRRHYPAVQRACARRVSAHEAEEIAQAAFVRALERIEQCGGQRQFGGWVQIIARHMCVDAQRAKSRVVPSESPMSEDHSDGNEPDDSLLDQERSADVRRALASLPPRQRQAVTARALGTRPGQIADDLGLSVGAVDSLILRGRRRLALAYQRVAGEGGATATATNATAAASLLAVISIGSTRLLGGVAAAAEAGRDLVAPVATGVAGAIMSVAVAIGGSAPATTPEPATVPSSPPAVVVSVPFPNPPGAVSTATAPGTAVSRPQDGTPGGAGIGSVDGIGSGTGSGTGTGAAGGPSASGATTPTPSAGPAPAPPPAALPVDAVVEPVVEVVDGALPEVAEVIPDPAPVVDTVGDVADDTVDAVTGLLPGRSGK